MRKLVGMTLAIVMLSGSIPLGFSEPLRVQLEAGIETNQLQCDNDSHVLVQRTNGNLACVSEKSAERTGWKIIKINFNENSSIQTISTGWWIGDCPIFDSNSQISFGTCQEDTTLTSNTINFNGEDLSSTCPQLLDESYSEKWNYLVDLIDLRKFNALPDNIGCPGCADAPIHHIEISDGQNSKRVQFETSDELPGIEEFASALYNITYDINSEYSTICLENTSDDLVTNDGNELIPQTNLEKTDPKQVQVKDNLEINDNVEISTNEIITAIPDELRNDVYFEIWTPVLKEKHVEVAELFVNALGDKIIDKVADTEKATAYTTEKGNIVLFTDPITVAHDLDAGIKYHAPTPLYDADERKKFVYNFMDAVGFTYDKKDLQINSISSRNTLYTFQNDKSYVEFRFGNSPGQGIALRFNGYSNDPTPLVYTLTPDETINKVYPQFPAGMILSEWPSTGEPCLHEPLPQDRVHISKIVVYGEPYYYMVIGSCAFPEFEFASMHLYVILDATEGETMSHWLWGGD